jgi:hypothetical protein
MKALISAAGKARQSPLPITRFAFQEFAIPVRRVTGGRPLNSGTSFKKANTRLRWKLKSIPKWFHAAQAASIFPPSPAIQGCGLMRLRFGARLDVHPAALSSPTSAISVPKLFNQCDAPNDKVPSNAGGPPEPKWSNGATPYSEEP